MKTLSTTFRGFAPDERGRDFPPECVYETERAPRPSWALKLGTLFWLAVSLYVIVGAALQGLNII